MMMTPVDQDDDVQTVVTAKNPNDPPGDYFRPPPQSPSDDDGDSNRIHRDEYGDDDDDDLASLSTMDTYTFRRLRDRRLRQHAAYSRGDVGHRRMDAEESGHNSIRVRDENNTGDGNSSFFSASSSMSMSGVLGRHPANSTSDHGKHPQRRFIGKQRQQRWTPLASSSSPTATTHPKSSSSRKNGVCGSNRFASIGLHTGSVREFSWQHAVLYLGMMGFGWVIWMTVSEMIITMSTEQSDDDHHRVVGLGMNNIVESDEKFDGGGANSDLQYYAGNYKNSTKGNSENLDFDDENAVLLTFDAMEDSAERPLGNIEMFDNAGEVTTVREEAGMEKGIGVRGQDELQQQLALQQQPQVDHIVLQSPPPPSSASASIPAEIKTVEQKSSPLISNIQDQGHGGFTAGEEKEGGGVILANNNNTSIYYDGIANDNPRLWGVKE